VVRAGIYRIAGRRSKQKAGASAPAHDRMATRVGAPVASQQSRILRAGDQIISATPAVDRKKESG